MNINIDLRVLSILIFSILFITSIVLIYKTNPSQKLLNWFAIFSFILAIISYFLSYVVYPPEKDYDTLKREIIKDIKKEFEEFEIDIRCDEFKNPILKDGAVYIDKCVFMYKTIELPHSGYIVDLKFRSNWKTSKKEHSIVSIIFSDGYLSLFEEQGVLNYIICIKNKIYGVRLQLDEVDWKDDSFSKDWNDIKIAWNKSRNKIWLSVNDVRVENVAYLNINTQTAKLLLGTSVDHKSFAEGWFDRIMIYKDADPANFGTAQVKSFKNYSSGNK